MRFIKISTLLIFILGNITYCLADNYKAKRANVAPVIDGNDNDVCWETVSWSPINQVWDPQGAVAGSPDDFTGHYKAVWTSDKLYILMRVTDDKLTFWNEGKDPLVDYYKTDCPEIFIDENHSKGDHLCNYNAFAYHISMIYNVVDNDNSSSSNCKPQLFNDVLTGSKVKIGNTYYWEFAMNVFTDKYVNGAANNPKASLYEGKVMGFSIAYNDSDDSWEREKMYGSQIITPDPKYGTNVSYINADYFGTMELVAADVTSGLENVENGSEIILHPNPASENLYINTAFPISKISIQDYTGKSFYRTYPEHNHGMIFVGDVPSGIYFIQFESENKLFRKKTYNKQNQLKYYWFIIQRTSKPGTYSH